ncbi:MAG: 16S rRNA (adenine(1518)-N(6)/adenine(1519)-N(6))-dimethyltransferase RsmA [Bacteroidales bacterium]|nr:16S rRNA (adenine(1518)-N(6)/adenine(1519)-N(6))-dimethyltransferase RsmA [Bacteroidales bacterium]
MSIRAKKRFGQHFLKDENIAGKIVAALSSDSENVLEIGPGTGVLTKYLLENKKINFYVIEVDNESSEFLEKHYPQLKDKIIKSDFLKFKIETIFNKPFAIIGNFPYNISSQILFKVLEHRNNVTEVIGMFQKEVAQRIASKSGTKECGILSVLMQAFYNIEYLFTVDETVFSPPPKVKSAVIRLTRNNIQKLDCDEEKFLKVVKTAFNQRRKTLRNALKVFEIEKNISKNNIFDKRAEELSVNDFVKLTNLIGGKSEE